MSEISRGRNILCSIVIATSSLLSFLAIVAMAAPFQPPKAEPNVPQSLRELRDADLQKAAESWRDSLRDSRQVADVVCLVPNRETFLQVLANWDDKFYFPILMDDSDLSVKFIRAFRPRKVIRFPERTTPIPDDALWVASLTSAVRAVVPKEDKPKGVVRGNIFWIQKPPRSPGVVLTKGGIDSVAAAALAAGRKQGLLLWPEKKGWKDELTFDEAIGRLGGLNELAKELKVESDRLGDDLDFVTLVGDLPYRYQTPEGINSLDDLMCRVPEGKKARRWAYVGRVTGDINRQIYQVMSGLFLQPAASVLFNGYDPADNRYSGYPLTGAQTRFSQMGLKVDHVATGSLGNWHKAFLPRNLAGMLMINSSGSPMTFNLRGGSGTTLDVPWTVPTRIHIIHSFSAADAQDPYTIAGRWLANGAYAYFGSVNEPYLQAFRSPSLISECLAEGYPWAAAVRQNPGNELFGQPWRLIVFGDPMSTLSPPNRVPPRARFDHVESWPSFAFEPLLPEDTADAAKMAWAVRQAMVWASDAKPSQEPKSILSVLESIDRDQLPAGFRATRDEFLAHMALESNQLKNAIDLATKIPAAERSPVLDRMIETAAFVRFQQAMSRAALDEALLAWRAIIQICPVDQLRSSVTDSVRKMINSPVRRRLWIRALEEFGNRKDIDEQRKKWAQGLIAEAEAMQL